MYAARRQPTAPRRSSSSGVVSPVCAEAAPPSSLIRAARRQWRRWTRRLRRCRIEVVYSKQYGLPASGLAYDALRGERILTFLVSEGLLHSAHVHEPEVVSLDDLTRTHTATYLESLLDTDTLTRILGLRVSPQEADRLLGIQRTMVGGTLRTTRLALSLRRPAVNLAGGFHHAHADRGGGFCALNDIAVAIARERDRGFDGPILVVDLDLHDGDGTRSLFADDDSVHTLSIHNGFWDGNPALASTSVDLGAEVDDATYLQALKSHLPTVLQEVRPELVYYIAGCDPADDDELGDWKITPRGMLERDRFVVQQLRSLPRLPSLVILLGGGYGREAWRYSARFLAWLVTARELEPPSTEEITLARYRHLTALRLRPSTRRSPADWGLSMDDLMPSLGSPYRESRFLGRYSKQVVELILEHTGLFDRLRSLGFTEPTLELDLDNPSGQTIRVFSDRSHRELLAELRARRDRSTVSGMEMLRIEWLLLQNPRLEFPAGVRPLPGQRHPGLGMLADVMALLVLACEQMGLDGVLFLPSHYHLAAQSRRFLRFLDPADEGRFRALERALAGMPLAAATAAVDQGRIVDLDSGQPVRWQPGPMVLPVSAGLEDRFRSPDYEEQAAREAARWRLTLHPPPSRESGV